MRSILNESEAKKLISACGIPVLREELAGSEGEALRIAEEIGYPILLKTDAPGIDGMELDVSSGDELIERFSEIKEKAGTHEIRVQEVLPRGREVMVGMMRDAALGPVVMFSLGGVFAEVIKDISFRTAPVTRGDALEMLKEVKAYSILEGLRGGGASDIESIVEVIENVSNLGMEQEDLVELEINPLFVHDKGAVAVSVKGVVERKE